MEDDVQVVAQQVIFIGIIGVHFYHHFPEGRGKKFELTIIQKNDMVGSDLEQGKVAQGAPVLMRFDKGICK